MPGSYIVAGARTPIGKLSGALSGLSAMDLGAQAIRTALERAGVAPEQVDLVFMGQVILAGTGQVPARQAAVKAGIPLSVPANTVNKACLSGLNTILLADLHIQAGLADVVVAGGMESMTSAPHLLMGARSGFKYGTAPLEDAILHDGLECAIERMQMGAATERDAAAAGIGREAMDEFAALSHERAASAIKEGRFDAEVVPVSIPQRKGDPVVVAEDEGVRPGTTPDTLGKLRGAFGGAGNVTAGNASQISDGGAAVLVASEAAVDRLGLTPLGQIISYGQVAGPGDLSLLLQPANAIAEAVDRGGLTVRDLDLIEINEAFAAVGLASVQQLGVSTDVVNVNGGAIALGHPVGMSGTRLALTLLHELHRRGGGVGAAGLCGAGGQGDAMVVRTV